MEDSPTPNSRSPGWAVLEDAQFDSSPSSRILQLQAHPNYLCWSDLRHMHSKLVHGKLNHVEIGKDEETRTNRGRGSDIKAFEPVRVCSLLSFCQMSKKTCDTSAVRVYPKPNEWPCANPNEFHVQPVFSALLKQWKLNLPSVGDKASRSQEPRNVET